MITPTKKEFLKLTEKGNLIPVSCEVLADTETPVSSFWKVAYDDDGKQLPYSFLLESVAGGENIARYSFLGSEPMAVFSHKDGQAFLTTDDGECREICGRDVFEKIHNVLSKYKAVEVPSMGMPPFTGGAVGYAAYDVVSEFETTVPKPDAEPVDVPDAFFMITGSLLAFDQVRNTIRIIVQAHLDGSRSPEDVYDSAVAKINVISSRLLRPAAFPPVNLDREPPDIPFDSNKTRSEFKKMVAAAKKYILDGDIIQSVLSQRLSVSTPVSPLSLHRALRMLNPSPYMFLLNCGDFALVGASPEVHAKCLDGKITVRPIAGTRKRGMDPSSDAELARELLADPKERAEHIMLVDLGRNDVGRIAEAGTISVDELMVIEKYSHVMHIVSNVTGKLAKGLEADAVMRSTFPAGTLSGAPKVRAMQIISELEGERRGPYGGAVAYYSFDGNLDSCITIRTALLKDGRAYVQSGAGIVADSVPEMEYEETLNKAKAMLKALSMAEKFELP
ncbi:MAG: anthranilate synthase component I [Victivallales bacterium]|nr:anthranilate synthase component I [Victivallales bacterium]